MSEKETELRGLLQAAMEGSKYTSPLPPPPPPIVKNLWYKNKIINLDGWVFESCRFDGCKLIASSPNFMLKECFIDDSNVIDFKGSIINVVQLSNFDNDAHPQNEAFHPSRNYDGTINIGV